MATKKKTMMGGGMQTAVKPSARKVATPAKSYASTARKPSPTAGAKTYSSTARKPAANASSMLGGAVAIRKNASGASVQTPTSRRRTTTSSAKRRVK